MSECEECKALRQRLARLADDILEEARMAVQDGQEGIAERCVRHSDAIKGLVGNDEPKETP